MDQDFFMHKESDKYEKDSNLTPIKDIIVKDIDGKERKFSEFLESKKAILVVNTASACGFTDSNYKGLVDLYEAFKDKGLTVLGFPCNQFRNQEDKCEIDIKNFTKNNYKVDFPMFSKVDVNGPNTHPLYINLKAGSSDLNLNDESLKNIPWNFSKFLLDNEGKVIKFYGPRVTPKDIESDVEKLLNA